MRCSQVTKCARVLGRPTGSNIPSAWSRTAVYDYLPILLGACAGWWRSDLGITLSGTKVSAWADQSGNGRTISQGTGLNQPAYASNGGSADRATLTFDGSASFMESATFAVATPHHVFLLAKWITVAASDGNVIFSGDSTIASNSDRVSVRTVSTALAIWGTGGGAIQTTTATTLAWHYWSLVWTGGANSTIAQDTANLATGNPGATAINGITLGGFHGGATLANAAISEVTIYSAPLSVFTELRLSNYYKARYAL